MSIPKAHAEGDSVGVSGRFAAVVAVAVLGLCVLGVGSAFGAVGRPFVSSFSGPVAGPFEEPDAVAVDQTDGRVFVGDASSGMLDVFSSSGTLLTQFGEGHLNARGVAVDEASGNVYVADGFENAVLVYKLEGASYVPLGEWSGEGLPGEGFGEVAGVAVDNSPSPSAGDVYVVDAEDPSLSEGAVDVFKPKPAGPGEGQEGDLVRVLSAGKMEEPNGAVVSSEDGKVYVADSAKGTVFRFSAAGALEEKLTGSGSPQGSFKGPEGEEGNVSAIALDETTGDLLVAEAERHVVSELNAAGEWVGWIPSTPSGAFGEPRGIGVGPTGQVYVADAGLEVVDVFGAGVQVPDVVTGKASKVARTSAILSGTIDGDGKAGEYHFEWGTSEALGKSTPTVGSAAGEEKVSFTLSELQPSTTYFFRIVGANANGSNVGLVREFTTPTAVEGVSTGPVTNLQPESVTLTGGLKPNGFKAHYFFEWGTTTAYGHKIPEPPVDAGEANESVKAETSLTGLAPNTVYHYRTVAENSLGITRGEDHKFTTSGPPRITVEAPTVIGHEQATLNAKINPGELPTSYHFEWGETTAYGHEAPTGGASLPAGETFVPVTTTLTALKIGVTYHYRVIASNGAPPATATGDQTFTTVPPAPIDATFATNVISTSAKLNTRINPLGHATSYYFQYGTQSCRANPSACTNIPSPPGAEIGSGETDQAASQAIGGLQPDTTYFYRVIDSNTLGTTEGPERTFKTRPEEAPSFSLPDGRAWEMVSPPNKGAPVEPLTNLGGLILASEDGSKITYVTNGAVGEDVEGNRTPELQQIYATRGPSSWRSQDIATPSTEAKGVTAGQAPEYQYFNPDLSISLVEPPGKEPLPPLAPGVTQTTPYLRDNAAETFLPVVNNQNTASATKFNTQVHFEGATSDLSHVVIGSRVGLLGEGSAQGIYEWAGGQLEQISILPNGTPATGLTTLGYNHVVANAISADGNRVEWTNTNAFSQAALGPLYLRDVSRGQTVRLDAAQGVAEPGAGEARYQTASSDGSKIFFTDWLKLTPNSTAEATAKQPDLYECEIVEQAGGKLACNLTDLTANANSGEHAAGVKGDVLASTADASQLFFVAQNILASNENGNHEKAGSGKNNLYEYRFVSGKWTATFIAGLSSEDSVEWENNNNSDTAYLTARVSPNGRYFAFMSAASLTGYDNTDQTGGQPDEEVFLYDTTNQALRCVSCNATGARPKGVFDTLLSGEGLGLVVDRRRIWSGEAIGEHWLAGNIPGWTAQSVNTALIQSRYLTDNGRLFFNSPDELVPEATNGKENVYEYEPSGLGSCQSPTGGCVSLLSSGTSAKESAFLEATPDGSNVFFITAQQLLPQDTDTAFDIYDARECTNGSPCQSPPSPEQPPCGSEGECRIAPPPVKAPTPPGGSATLTGTGNIVPAPGPKPSGEPRASKVTKPLTRAQKLAQALRACKKQHSKKERHACERRARKQYAPRHPTKKKAKKARAKRSSHQSATGRAAR